MHVLPKAFWLPKAGLTFEEYEDAFWTEKRISYSTSLFRFAVADGATEASFSGLWARMLTRAYCRGHLSESKTFLKCLIPLQQAWKTTVRKKPLPWYAEEKIKQGAFSTLLGLTIRRAQRGTQFRWDALAIGDSCLFQIRGDSVIAQFPLTCSDQFNSHPALLPSNPAGNSRLAPYFRSASGKWRHGDAFYLMTDAMACWFLSAVEKGRAPWAIIRDLGTEGGLHFEEWVGQLRQERQLRNDDVTLFRVVMAEDMV